VLTVFGQTLAGERVQGSATFPVNFCFNCGGCFWPRTGHACRGSCGCDEELTGVDMKQTKQRFILLALTALLALFAGCKGESPPAPPPVTGTSGGGTGGSGGPPPVGANIVLTA